MLHGIWRLVVNRENSCLSCLYICLDPLSNELQLQTWCITPTKNSVFTRNQFFFFLSFDIQRRVLSSWWALLPQIKPGPAMISPAARILSREQLEQQSQLWTEHPLAERHGFRGQLGIQNGKSR